MGYRKIPDGDLCASCRFWARGPNGSQRGHCRRHAPALGKYGHGSWPETDEGSWCGSWKGNGSETKQVGSVPAPASGVVPPGPPVGIQQGTPGPLRFVCRCGKVDCRDAHIWLGPAT